MTNFPSGLLNQWQAASAWLTGLSSAGEDARDWRLQFRGFSWPAMTVSRTGNVVVDACTSTANWMAGAYTTLGSSGVQATASGGTGSVVLSVPSSVKVWEAFRYLSITAEATTSAPSPPSTIPILVRLAGQTWKISVPVGSSSTLTIDLTVGGSESSSKNQYSTRFPVDYPGISPDGSDPSTQYKMGWGVDFCDSLTIIGFPDGYTLVLGGIDLTLSSAADKEQAITFLEPFLNFVPGWVALNEVSTTSVQQYCLIQSDHRVSDVGVVMALINSSEPYYSFYTIGTLAGLLNYLPGVSATLLTPPTDTYHTSGLIAFMLGGSGSTYNWTANTWTDWIDVDLSAGPVTVPSQDLWDEVQVYPGAGQVWTGSGAYDIATPLQVTKFLRAEANGICYQPNNTPNVGAAIQTFLTSIPATLCGNATTVSSVIADKEPDALLAASNADRTIIKADPHRPPIVSSLDVLKIQPFRRWVIKPEKEFLLGESLSWVR